MNWRLLTFRLIKCGIKPWEVKGLTLSEVALMLGDHDGVSGNMDEASISEYVESYNAMSHQDRLEAALNGVI